MTFPLCVSVSKFPFLIRTATILDWGQPNNHPLSLLLLKDLSSNSEALKVRTSYVDCTGLAAQLTTSALLNIELFRKQQPNFK